MIPPLFQPHPMTKCIDTAMDILTRGVNRDRIFRMSMSFGDFLLDYSQKGVQRNRKNNKKPRKDGSKISTGRMMASSGQTNQTAQKNASMSHIIPPDNPPKLPQDTQTSNSPNSQTTAEVITAQVVSDSIILLFSSSHI